MLGGSFPQLRVVGSLPNRPNGLQMEVTKHLLIGMILQVWGGYFLKLGGGGSLQKMGEMIKF